MINRLDIVYLGEHKTPYLVVKDLPVNNCVVCLKDKPTVSHHLVPKRANTNDRMLSQLRIRVCKHCHEMIHAENGVLDGFAIIKKQAAKINKLKNDVKELKQRDYSWLLELIDKRREKHVNNIPKFIKALKEENNFKAINPMMKLMEGRIKELEHIRSITSAWIHQDKRRRKEYN